MRNKFILSVCVLMALSVGAFAASSASDTAADPVYNAGWTSGMNGGTGFGAWVLTTSGANSGHFIGSSINNGDGIDDGTIGGLAGDGDIDTPADQGRSWGMYANSGDLAEGIRPFTGALSVGDTFSIDMDNGYIDTASTVGFSLRNANAENVWEFYFVGGDASYTINDGAGPTLTGIGFADEGVHVDFTLTAPSSYSATVTRRDLTSDNFTGSLMTPANGQSITEVRLFNASAGQGSSNDAYFNNMQVIPEPASVALLALGLIGVGAYRRKRG